MKKRFLLTHVALALIAFIGATPVTMPTVQAQENHIFRATGNDREAIQKTIDEASAKRGVAYLPAGEYQIDGDLWLTDHSILRGDGDVTVLRFSKGQIRSLKNGSKSFYYTNNYFNEVVPNPVNTGITKAAAKGENKIEVADAARFQKGDWVYTDDNRKDTWEILEDPKRAHLWNDPKAPLARQQIFQIIGIEGNAIEFNNPLDFGVEPGNTLRKHVGARDFEVSSLKIIHPTELRPLHFEQPMNARFTNLTIEAKGGITLSHKAYNNLIENCRFITKGWRGVTVEYFCGRNRVVGNSVDYIGGGDAAILIMISSWENNVSYNSVRYVAEKNGQPRDEGGIYIHATTYNNTVHNNNVNGTIEAYGNFFGADNNVFFDNIGTNVRMGIVSYYARNNVYLDNVLTIVPKPPIDTEGALIYGSFGNLFRGNHISGQFVNGLRIQGSHSIDVIDNVLAGSGESLFGFRYYDKDVKTGDTFNGVNPRSGLRRGNVVSGVKTQEGSQ